MIVEVFFALLKAMLWLIKWFVLTLALSAVIMIGAMLIVAIYSWLKG